MDADAGRRAAPITPDLTQAYTDEQACPPEWVDLMTEIDDSTKSLRAGIERDAASFASEPDIRRALAARDRADAAARAEIDRINAKVRRLNLIAPSMRFGRTPLDAEPLLRPLWRQARIAGGTIPSEPGVRGPGTRRNS